MSNDEEFKFISSESKISIFDGTDKSKYQLWEDDLIAILEYHDIEEYIEND